MTFTWPKHVRFGAKCLCFRNGCSLILHILQFKRFARTLALLRTAPVPTKQARWGRELTGLVPVGAPTGTVHVHVRVNLLHL